MNRRPALSLAEELCAAQDWWREAGLGYRFADKASPWIEEEGDGPAGPQTAPAAIPELTEQPRIGGDCATWPGSLPEFRDWWLSEPTLDEGGAHSRITPRGEAGADLMVVVPEPEADDRDTLLSGTHGELLRNMLAAMGIGTGRAYIATALPRHMPLPDWPLLAKSGMGEVLRHHIALVRPARLLILGNNILPLLGHDPAQPLVTIRETAIQGVQVPTLAARGPAYLLTRADARAALWQRWLDWTSGEGSA